MDSESGASSYARLSERLMSSAGDEDIVEMQRALTACKARSPEQGGDGEQEKAAWIRDFLTQAGVPEISTLECPDPRVSHGSRPTVIATIKGKSRKTLWIFSHTDVVAAGDRDAWHHDPWQVQRDGDWVIGRGVEDNQQALVSTLRLARALREEQITPDLSLGMVFMADEESGSRYGLAHVLKTMRDAFADDDIFLVPDFGTSDGSIVEIAEKGCYWYRFTVTGKQCHASTPEKGINAFVAASALVVRLAEELPASFPERSDLFSPPHATFVPGMPLTVTEGVNIVPGKAIFHLDCRVLPNTRQEDLETVLGNIAGEIANRYTVSIERTTIQAQKATAVSPNGAGFAALARAVDAVYGKKLLPKGLGGGTVAALLREAGLPALVWSCIANTCHEPNERSSITATKKDSCVFAHILCERA